MGKTITKVLFPILPALAMFGPLFISFGVLYQDRIWAYLGSFMTGFAIIILFLRAMDQSKELEKLARQLQNKESPN